MKYTLVWIDDQFDEQEAMFDLANANEIELIPHKTSKAGMQDLEKNLWKYDGIILDAKVFNESEDEVADLDGLYRAVGRLKELTAKRVLPLFIFTGQQDLLDNATFAKTLPDIPIYKKGIDVNRLMSDIKIAADKLPETQIKQDFAPAFEACEVKYLGEESKKILLQILKSIRSPLESFDDQLYFTQIRIMLEAIFRAANKAGLLHDACIINGKVNLSESSLFLSGQPTKHLGVSCSKCHFNQIIANNVRIILQNTGAGSHTTEIETKNNPDLKAYRKYLNTPYLLYSLAFQLMDVLIWFRTYSEENSDTELNKTLWVSALTDEILWYNGYVKEIKSNGYGDFVSEDGKQKLTLIPPIINSHKLRVNQKVRVSTTLKDGKRRIKDLVII